jgi:hypothetical protein
MSARWSRFLEARRTRSPNPYSHVVEQRHDHDSARAAQQRAAREQAHQEWLEALSLRVSVACDLPLDAARARVQRLAISARQREPEIWHKGRVARYG